MQEAGGSLGWRNQSRCLRRCVAMGDWEVRRVLHLILLNMGKFVVDCMLLAGLDHCKSAVAPEGWPAIRGVGLQLRARFAILVVQVVENAQSDATGRRISRFRFTWQSAWRLRCEMWVILVQGAKKSQSNPSKPVQTMNWEHRAPLISEHLTWLTISRSFMGGMLLSSRGCICFGLSEPHATMT
jgi:hypothetical protein